jgi:hypothetical protein
MEKFEIIGNWRTETRYLLGIPVSCAFGCLDPAIVNIGLLKRAGNLLGSLRLELFFRFSESSCETFKV